jgi:hypothetical protein
MSWLYSQLTYELGKIIELMLPAFQNANQC